MAIRSVSRIQWRTLANIARTTREGLKTGEDKEEKTDSSLPVIIAEPRDPKFMGRKRKNDRLRELGMTPALLNNIAKEGRFDQEILTIRTSHFRKVIRSTGGNDAFMSRPLKLHVHDAGKIRRYTVLARQLRLSTDDFRPNNATFRVLKPTDIVRVHVPVAVVGEDACPGLKDGFPLILKYTLRIKCRGDQIPPRIQADITGLEFNQKLFVRDLPLPEGCEYLHENARNCVVKISAYK